VFVSEEFYKSEKNIFCLGDAFFAYPPSFAQGASQSIESAFELYKDIIDEKNNFYNNRIIKSKRVNLRSKLNQFTFHISNPLLVYIRNFLLKILVKNKKFLDSYLGKVYKN
jgi:salicylate hydroxylase